MNNFQDCFGLLSFHEQKKQQKLSTSISSNNSEQQPQKRRRSALINLEVDEELNKKYHQIYLLFQSRNQNQGEYQQYISNLKSEPSIPFFNLKTFQMIDKEHKDFKISNEMINWRKRCLQFDEISKFLMFQEISFEFKEIPKLMDLIEDELNKI